MIAVATVTDVMNAKAARCCNTEPLEPLPCLKKGDAMLATVTHLHPERKQATLLEAQARHVAAAYRAEGILPAQVRVHAATSENPGLLLAVAGVLEAGS